ncbi:MAG TPA: TorF family putative porin [Alphaproteobacteria bacterium]|nr:TorF family putative porin [Alphaproteobacteria bacterium]
MHTRFAAFLLAALSVLLGIGTSALADDAPEKLSPIRVTANVDLTTDYVFRGVSQTGRGIAIQGGFDASDGWAYVGTWASNVDFGAAAPDANLELDLYGGIRPEIGATTFDFGFIYYKYPNARSSDHLDYYEFYGGVAEDFHFVQVAAKIFYTPNNTLDSKEALYYQGNATVPVTKELSVNGHVGHYAFDRNDLAGPDYTDWTIGLQYTWGPVTIGGTYGDTDRKGAKDDEGWLTVSHTFQ